MSGKLSTVGYFSLKGKRILLCRRSSQQFSDPELQRFCCVSAVYTRFPPWMLKWLTWFTLVSTSLSPTLHSSDRLCGALRLVCIVKEPLFGKQCTG